MGRRVNGKTSLGGKPVKGEFINGKNQWLGKLGIRKPSKGDTSKWDKIKSVDSGLAPLCLKLLLPKLCFETRPLQAWAPWPDIPLVTVIVNCPVCWVAQQTCSMHGPRAEWVIMCHSILLECFLTFKAWSQRNINLWSWFLSHSHTGEENQYGENQ